MYSVDCSDLEILEKGDDTWIKLQVEFENTIDPFLVFDYELEEKQLFANVGKYAFLLVDGEYLLSMRDVKEPGSIPSGFILKRSATKVVGNLSFVSPVKNPQSIVFYYFHEEYGMTRRVLLGEDTYGYFPVKSDVVSSDKVEFAMDSFGVWKAPVAVVAAEGSEFYYVDFWGRSIWKHEVPGYNLNPEAGMDSVGVVDFPFAYQKCEYVLNLLLEDEFSYVYRADLSEFSQPLTFISNVWSKVRLVFEIPKRRGKLDFNAQFIKMGLSDGGVSSSSPISIPIKKGKPLELDRGSVITLQDKKNDLQLDLSMGLVSDLESWGIDSSRYVGLAVSYTNRGTNGGLLKSTHRFWLGLNEKVRAVLERSVNAYLPPETLFVDPNQRRSLLLIYPKSALDETTPVILNYSGIGDHYVFKADLTVNTLVQVDFDSLPGAKRVSKSADPVKSNSSLPKEKKSKESEKNSKTFVKLPAKPAQPEEPKEPLLAVVPFEVEETIPYHAEAEKMALEDFNRLGTLPFLSSRKFGYHDFESIHGNASALESEPNDEFETSNRFNLGQVVKGQLEEQRSDYWVVSIEEDLATNERLSIQFAVDSANESVEGAYLYLYDAEEDRIMRVWAEDTYTAHNCVFEAGDYYLKIENYSEQPAFGYYLKLDRTEVKGSVEKEYNDDIEHANVLAFGEMVSGSLDDADEDDFYKVVFTKEHSKKRWDILLQSDHADEGFTFRLLQEDGDVVFRGDNKGKGLMSDLSPTPGVYFLKIACSTEEQIQYHLEIVDRGYLTSGWEREPNDRIDSKTVYVIEDLDDTRPELLGRFQQSSKDYFALNVKDFSKMYTLTLGGKTAEQIVYQDRQRGELRRVYPSKDMAASLVDLRLPLGLNYFYVQGKPGDYAINVQEKAIPGEFYEWEPNDSNSQAQLLRMGEAYSGRLLDNRDTDYFRMVVHQPMSYRLELESGEGGITEINLKGDGFQNKRILPTESESTSISEHYLLPGNYFLFLRAKKPSFDLYRLKVSPVNPFGSTEAEPTVSIEDTGGVLQAAAFVDDYQSVLQKLRISNTGDQSLDIKLIGKASHHAVVLDEGSVKSLKLASGESIDIELRWIIAPQIWGDDQISLFVHAQSSQGSVGNTEGILLLSNLAVAVGVQHNMQYLPARLAGGVNLNLITRGAEVVVPAEGTYPPELTPGRKRDMEYLMDGVLSNRSFNGFQAVSKMLGEGRVNLVGTSIDLHGSGSLWESAKAFAIDLSDDGVTYREVLSAELKARTGDQFFLFDQPQKAKFSRLRILSQQSEVRDAPHVGEWRMIADPEAVIPGLERIDLLDEKNGGHLIYEHEEGNPLQVYGFHHGRAARLSEIRWKNERESTGYYRNTQHLTIEGSMDSPVGPWRILKEFDLTEADSPELESIQSFDENTWARYLRVSWPAVGEDGYGLEPEAFELIEEQISPTYRSIIGEWNGTSRKAYFEYQMASNQNAPEQEFSRIASSEVAPYPLNPETWVSSVAWINKKWEDWYSIESVKVKKRLQFTVQGSPFVKVTVELFDANGMLVDVRESENGSKEKTFQFMADPGMRYKIHVYEPKRSIVYLWDVSGSMSSFVPSIENAVLAFAQGIDIESEKVQLLPFDEPAKLLLQDWASDSYLLQNTVRSYSAPSSSYAHLNLLAATAILKEESGTRAAIVITDCESNRGVNEQLWSALQEVKPAVFTFQTSNATQAYGLEQDDMQDWAAVGGGFYYSTRAAHELDTAFARVQAYLRRPAPYLIHLTAPELKPSFIQVVDNRKEEDIKDPAKDAILLIIDVSASMREKLPDGQMKASAAKKVIQELVDNYLPEGVNFGLRVFGHRGGKNCESELMIPVEPLNPDIVRQKLMMTRSSSLGNTALAESLTWAKEDFGDFEGKKRVIVLTDGEETCHGDPAAVIAELASEGLEVTVNIVGFTLGDEEVKTQYHNWVKSTGGKYFDAQDTATLGRVLQKAMTPVELPNFQILDASGEIVAEAQVGDSAVQVDSGSYTVKILDPDAPREEKVDAFETTITINYK